MIFKIYELYIYIILSNWLMSLIICILECVGVEVVECVCVVGLFKFKVFDYFKNILFLKFVLMIFKIFIGFLGLLNIIEDDEYN